MSKRRVTENYRKIFIESRGEIPLDENGRSFEIHHLDGDYTNNAPENLVASFDRRALQNTLGTTRL